MKTKEFVFRSKSNPNNQYIAILYADGTTSCNCRGWTMKRSNKERGCRHTKEVEANNPLGGAAPAAPKKKAAPIQSASSASPAVKDVEPMAAGVLKGAELTNALDSDRWVAEEKLDGARYILHLLKGGNRMFSRRKSTTDGLRIERTPNVPHLRDLKHSLIGTRLDGEIVTGANCKSNDVTRVMGSHHQRAIEVQERIGFVTYKVFDILEHKGKDLRGVPYSERYKILLEVIKELNSKYLVLPARATRDKLKFCEKIWAAGGEGIILKNLDGLYTEGSRSTDAWVKVKRQSTWNVICSGYTTGKNAFADTFGAIKFSMYVKGKLTEVGQCSGMTLAIRNKVHGDRDGFLGKVFEVTGQEITDGGRVRHPRFKGWRLEVDPKTCTAEDESKSA